MRVLFVCHRFPYPPKRGGKIRPFNIIRHLAESAEVTVASLARSHEEAREGRGIAPHCHAFHVQRIGPAAAAARMLLRLPTAVPSSMGYFYSPRLARDIDSLLRSQRFDLIFVHCSSVAQYVARAGDVPRILDFGDMDSQKWLEYARYKPLPWSVGYRLEGAKLQRAEKALAATFDICTCTTRGELETLQSFGAARATGWFPNGVDSDFFQPLDEPYDPDAVCFVGRMDYYPNQQCMFDFCRDVLPILRRARPATTLTIVGADPSAAVRALGELDGVTVTGSVPDVRPFVRRCALTVAPLAIARGTQNKILESLAMGVPVVASSRAGVGVDAVAGEHFLAGDDPAQYAAAILSLLNEPAKRAQFAAAGRARMLSHHSWSGSMKRLDEIVAQAMAGSPRAETGFDTGKQRVAFSDEN